MATDDRSNIAGINEEVLTAKHERRGVSLGARFTMLVPLKDNANDQSAPLTQADDNSKEFAAETKDQRLYELGHERHEGDFCPICTLPVPFPVGEHANSYVCCMKSVCKGCSLASRLRGMGDICVFCRTPVPGDDHDSCLAMVQKRVDVGDAKAMYILAGKYYYGKWGLEKDVNRAVELWTEAAELGSLSAQYNLGRAYYDTDGIERDETRAVELWQRAAMKGHAESRHLLAAIEGNKGNYRLAVKHLLISAKMGYKYSLDAIRNIFMSGDATKVAMQQKRSTPMH